MEDTTGETKFIDQAFADTTPNNANESSENQTNEPNEFSEKLKEINAKLKKYELKFKGLTQLEFNGYSNLTFDESNEMPNQLKEVRVFFLYFELNCLYYWKKSMQNYLIASSEKLIFINLDFLHIKVKL